MKTAKKHKAVNGKAKTKICKNPHCAKAFVPGHYHDRQLVCSGRYLAKCGKCKGSGRREGQKCFRCLGKGTYQDSCRNWYKGYWASIRKVPRAIPTVDLKKLLKAAPDVAHRALVTVAAQSGMRKGELLGLTWGDVLDGKEVRSSFDLIHQWDDTDGMKTTKTDTARDAFLLPESRQALKQYRELILHSTQAGKSLDDRIWPWSEVYAWSWFTKLEKKLGIKNPDTGRPYRFHDMRHTAAINTLQATGDIHQASILLGHGNSSTTMIYTKERPEAFVAGLESAFRKKRR